MLGGLCLRDPLQDAAYIAPVNRFLNARKSSGFCCQPYNSWAATCVLSGSPNSVALG